MKVTQVKEPPQVKLPRICQIFEDQRALEAKAGGLFRFSIYNQQYNALQ